MLQGILKISKSREDRSKAMPPKMIARIPFTKDNLMNIVFRIRSLKTKFP